MEKYVTKRDGNKELFDFEKINQKVLYACEGLNVSVSDVILDADFLLVDGIETKNIQRALIQSALNKINPKDPKTFDYDLLATRLLYQILRKEVYGSFKLKEFSIFLKEKIKAGIYSEFETPYTDDELKFLGSKIRYELDIEMSFTALSQFYNKYLVKENGKCIELPQEVYMLICMYAFQNSNNRIEKILNGYYLLSNKKVSFPTPIMNSLRTKHKSYISCNVIDVGDDIKSLSLATSMIMESTANKAGLGLNLSKIRGKGALVKGRIIHTGILPLAKTFESATRALTQESRGGSSNANYPFFHSEIELITELKNTRGTYETRCRHMDITIIINKWFISKVLKDENIHLFYSNDAKDLYENLGNYNKFDEIYNNLVKQGKSVSEISAKHLFEKMLSERVLTGRVYFVFADNMKNSAFKKPIYNTNLCCEIVLPNSPLGEKDGEIASCILASLNHGFLEDHELHLACDFLVEFLDNLIDITTFTNEFVKYGATKRRALGIGHSDIFHFLAKNKKFYNTNEGRELVRKRCEFSLYFLLCASNRLAKLKGKCELFNETRYSEGWLPFELSSGKLSSGKLSSGNDDSKLDQKWLELRNEIRKFGLRNSTLVACAPCGNSANTTGSTSGVEPPRELLTFKEDKYFKNYKIVPDYEIFGKYYTTTWGIDFNNLDYFRFLGEIQKYTDQSISTNQYTNVLTEKVKMSTLYNEIITAMNCGLKTLYYQNFRGNDESDGLKCSSGGCEV